MGLFRTGKPTTSVAATPAQLFQTLQRDPGYKFLWGHQQQLLDAYHTKHLTTPNVALELPTGAGKTLIGLLIAEWRRRARGERVLYLCPTRQLCHQVKAQADTYGIASVVLVGPQKDYPAGDEVAYRNGRATAITTYSALFNSNPRLNDAQLIICDDAHAGDEFIARAWALAIPRANYPRLFEALVAFLGEAIPEGSRRRIERASGDPTDRGWVDLVPLPRYGGQLTALEDLLDEHTRDCDLAYAWQLIHGHLAACALYVTADSFLLRPLLPPTETHRPFAGATQRLFMSATLGEGGELERLTGVRTIARLPLPEGAVPGASGQRLILFPDLLADEGAPALAVEAALERGPRTLVLAPDHRRAERFIADYDGSVTIRRAGDIERGIAAFTSAPAPAALVLANRYDGVDLPGAACRQLVISDLPVALNLPEQFLQSRLQATAQLRSRIRTRLTQGLGRCTRDQGDYAVALLAGRELLNWCANQTNAGGLDPQLQAEIAFGIENSNERTIEDFGRLQEAFLARDSDWAAAEGDIAERRERAIQSSDPATGPLERSVTHELAAVYALWRDDFAHAHDQASRAVDALGGDDLRPYRAFWHYVAAAAADLATRQQGDGSWHDAARDHLGRAVGLAPAIPWFAQLRDALGATSGAAAPPGLDPAVVRGLLAEWGTVGGRFERQLNAARAALGGDTAAKFEAGLATLGRMLGYDARRWPDEAGAPDGLWRFPDGTGVAFEAKTEENPAHAISMETVRQALTHPTWLRENGDLGANDPCEIVLISAQRAAFPEAARVAEGVRLIHPDVARDLFAKAATVLNAVRPRARALSDEALDLLIVDEYRRAGLTQSEVLPLLLTRRVADLPLLGGAS